MTVPFQTSTAGIDMKVDRSAWSIKYGRPRPLAPMPVPSLLSKQARAAFAEVEALAQREKESRAEAHDLTQSIESVRIEEQAANVEAAREGKALASSRIPQIEEAARAKQTEANTLGAARRAALDDAITLLASERDETAERGEEAIGAALSIVKDTCDRLSGALDVLNESVLALRWIHAVAEGNYPNRATKVQYRSSVLKPSGLPYTVGDLVDVIDSTVDEMLTVNGFKSEE
jgi:hypothetical protein